MRVLRKVHHPPVSNNPQDAGNQSLDKVHPAPARHTCNTLEMIETEINYVTSGKPEDLPCLQKSESELLLATRVPSADEVRQTGIDARHGDTQEHAQGDHLTPGVNESGAQRQQPEDECNRPEPDPGAHETRGHRAWQVKDHTGDGKDENGDWVARSLVQLEVA